MEKHIDDIKAALSDFATKERRERTRHYMSTSQQVLGVSNPDLRLVIKDLRSLYRSWGPQDWISLSKALATTGIFECQICGFELLAGNRKVLMAMKPGDVKALRINLDNWASVDHFSVGIHGVLWGMGILEDDYVFGLLDSEDVWMRRVAIVSSVALNTRSRGGTGDARRTLIPCAAVVDERHHMIWKAVSWALRSLVRWDPGAVEDFLSEYEGRMSKQAFREVRHKLDHGTKN